MSSFECTNIDIMERFLSVDADNKLVQWSLPKVTHTFAENKQSELYRKLGSSES